MAQSLCMLDTDSLLYYLLRFEVPDQNTSVFGKGCKVIMAMQLFLLWSHLSLTLLKRDPYIVLNSRHREASV